MKIEENTKTSTIDKSSVFVLINILVPFLIFLVASILIIQVWKNEILDDLYNRTLKYGTSFATEKLLTKDDAENMTESWYIIYYDKNGYYIANDAIGCPIQDGMPRKIDDKQIESLYSIGNMTYMAMVIDVEIEQEYGADFLVIYRNIESENAMFEKGTAISITILLGTMVFLIIFSILLRKYQIRPYKKLLDSSNRMISDISHELNTPLAIIKTNVDSILAHSDKTIEDSSEKLMVILDEATRMKRMVRDLLELSRSDNNRMVINKTYCNISQLIQEIVEPFELMCQLEDKTFIADIMPNIMVTTDADKIRQAVMILLDNAVKYTRPGDAIILQIGHNSSKVRISVADTGAGVSDEDLSRLFDRFYRADNSRTQGGSGLGLSIVKALAQTLKWDIHASHNRPHGFRIDIEMHKIIEE